MPVAAQLSKPGQKVANLQAVVSISYLEGQQAGSLAQPGLPRPDPPANPKVAYPLSCLLASAQAYLMCLRYTGMLCNSVALMQRAVYCSGLMTSQFRQVDGIHCLMAVCLAVSNAKLL